MLYMLYRHKAQDTETGYRITEIEKEYRKKRRCLPVMSSWCNSCILLREVMVSSCSKVTSLSLTRRVVRRGLWREDDRILIFCLQPVYPLFCRINSHEQVHEDRELSGPPHRSLDMVNNNSLTHFEVLVLTVSQALPSIVSGIPVVL